MDGSNEHRINIMKRNKPFSWRKKTPNERAAMQNERRKRKRKARAANKEDKTRKALSALEDERAMTLAKNERLLHLARKYYAKWHALHLSERVGTSFDVTFRSPLNII